MEEGPNGLLLIFLGSIVDPEEFITHFFVKNHTVTVPLIAAATSQELLFWGLNYHHKKCNLARKIRGVATFQERLLMAPLRHFEIRRFQ